MWIHLNRRRWLAILPASLCNRLPFTGHDQSIVQIVIMIFYIPQNCSFQESLWKYCWPIWNQKRMQWPTQPRNLFWIPPLKTPLKTEKKKSLFFVLQKLYKKACLKLQNYAHTNTDTCAHTHTSRSKNIRYVVGKARGKVDKIRRFDQLKMLECYSNVMEVVLCTYIQKGGQAGSEW